MSVTASPIGDKEVEVALDLLIEYTEKLRLMDIASEQSSKKIKYMGAHLVGLSRRISQMIEHGKIHALDKINLALRLSEFEHQLNRVLPPSSKESSR